MWEVYVTAEVDAWLTELSKGDRGPYEQVVAAIYLLEEGGPGLGKPLVDRVQGAALHNLKEMRPGSAGSTELRLLFVFVPWRCAIVLARGNKTGDWTGWYRENIPRAERLYVEYLGEPEEGRGDMRRWPAIKNEHIQAVGPERVQELKGRMMADVHGYRLAEARKRRGLTQAQVAERMGVTPGRVSQIERGEVTDLGTEIIGRYVEALGGRLVLVAQFEDETIRVG